MQYDNNFQNVLVKNKYWSDMLHTQAPNCPLPLKVPLVLQLFASELHDQICFMLPLYNWNVAKFYSMSPTLYTTLARMFLYPQIFQKDMMNKIILFQMKPNVYLTANILLQHSMSFGQTIFSN